MTPIVILITIGLFCVWASQALAGQAEIYQASLQIDGISQTFDAKCEKMQHILLQSLSEEIQKQSEKKHCAAGDDCIGVSINPFQNQNYIYSVQQSRISFKRPNGTLVGIRDLIRENMNKQCLAEGRAFPQGPEVYVLNIEPQGQDDIANVPKLVTARLEDLTHAQRELDSSQVKVVGHGRTKLFIDSKTAEGPRTPPDTRTSTPATALTTTGL